jgi:hypothetical protein
MSIRWLDGNRESNNCLLRIVDLDLLACALGPFIDSSNLFIHNTCKTFVILAGEGCCSIPPLVLKLQVKNRRSLTLGPQKFLRITFQDAIAKLFCKSIIFQKCFAG